MIAGPEMDRARESVAAGAREVARRGLVSGGSGNVSLALGEVVAITPGGSPLAELSAADVVIVDRDGRLVEGDGRPSSETALHLAAGGAAVVHTHSEFATVLACFDEQVPPVHYLVSRFGGPVQVVPYETFGSAELATAVGEALRDRRAALMQNHGAVVVAATVAEAVELAALLEWTCALAYRARLLGRPRELSAAELEETARRSRRLRYGERR